MENHNIDQRYSRLNEFRNFEEFWSFYVCEHSDRLNRRLHFAGIVAVFILLGFAITYHLGLLFLLPIVGYGFAWIGHFFIEKNKPASFQYPLWSLLGDFRMFFLMCAGKMDEELERSRIARE